MRLKLSISYVVVLLEDVPGILDQNFFGRSEDVVFEVIHGNVVTGWLGNPLEIVLEIVRDMLLDIELVDSQAVGYEHSSLSQLQPNLRPFLLVVLFRY